MSIDTASTPGQQHAKCARCGRQFQTKNGGDQYGPSCAKHLRGQMKLDGTALIAARETKQRSTEKRGLN